VQSEKNRILSDSNSDILIVGAGQATGQLLISLKQKKYKGKIKVFADEKYYPYQRPPLSKKYLSGELSYERLFIKQRKFFDELDVEFNLSCRVEKISTNKKKIQTKEGQHNYERLVIATGTRPRRISIDSHESKNIYYLRNIEDAEKIKHSIKQNQSIVIIGGGYIGLEVAATAIKFGCEVTVIEQQDRVMKRVVSKEVSNFFEDYHLSQGVRFIFNDEINSIKRVNNKHEISLSTGKIIHADSILVGIGGIPNTEIVENTDIEINNGISIDSKCRTNINNIFSMGDCTNFWSELYGKKIRLESVQNAIDQAKVLADNIMNIDSAYDSVPWFWSDQYDLKLQIAGLSEGYDETILRGDKKTKSFSCLYLKEGKIIAIDAINRPKDFIQSKVLIQEKRRIDREKASNDDFELKQFI
tara:strand:+ start:19352 stop:20596 length:1245 start_codon:yes stop_codon:yes gene_type:complete